MLFYLMKCFTLDTNCIIDLEEDRANAVHIRDLIQSWQDGLIELAVVSVSASENQPSGTALKNYGDFETKLERVGLLKATELQPTAYWDFGFWDHCLWAGEETETEVSEIKDVLFPDAVHEPPEDPSENSKWRNKMCDVIVGWSHRFHSSDYLVTSDDNFHRKSEQLAAIDIHKVVTPEQAVQIARRIT